MASITPDSGKTSLSMTLLLLLSLASLADWRASSETYVALKQHPAKKQRTALEPLAGPLTLTSQLYDALEQLAGPLTWIVLSFWSHSILYVVWRCCATSGWRRIEWTLRTHQMVLPVMVVRLVVGMESGKCACWWWCCEGSKKTLWWWLWVCELWSNYDEARGFECQCWVQSRHGWILNASGTRWFSNTQLGGEVSLGGYYGFCVEWHTLWATIDEAWTDIPKASLHDVQFEVGDKSMGQGGPTLSKGGVEIFDSYVTLVWWETSGEVLLYLQRGSLFGGWVAVWW